MLYFKGLIVYSVCSQVDFVMMRIKTGFPGVQG